MAVNSSSLGTRHIENALRRGAKTALVTAGIQPSTRRGNKELDLAVQRLAQQPYSSLEEAAKTGEALGQKIVELSQAQGKTDLDGGIVRQMMLTGEIPTVVKAVAKPAKTTPVVVETAPKPVAEAKAEAIAPAAIPDSANAIADEPEAIADDAEIPADAAEAIAEDAIAAEPLETVDAELADAPNLAAIVPPAPEPAIAADEALAAEAAPDVVGAAQ